MLAKLGKNWGVICLCPPKTELAKKATTTQLCGCSELADEAEANQTGIH